MKNEILITGHNGYIGSVMAPLLLRAGYEVAGLDTAYFAPCGLSCSPLAVPGGIRTRQ